MHKVYLLLRNNRQSGPYSLEELLQLNLKPFDLVWVEGRSAAWRYPTEIDSLKIYVTDSEFVPAESPATLTVQEPAPIAASSGRKVFVSMPGRAPQVPLQIYEEPETISEPEIKTVDPIELKAEEIARKVQAYNEQKTQEPVEVKTQYARSVNDLEEEYTGWMYRAKTAKKKRMSIKDLGIAVCILAVIIAGYVLMSRPALVQPSTTPVSTASASPQNSEIVSTNLEDNHQNINNSQSKAEPSLKNRHPENLDQPVKEAAKKSVALPEQKQSSQNGNEETIAGTSPEKQPETDVKEPVAEEQVGQPGNGKTTETRKEKKRLGDVVRDLFGKKEKKAEKQSEPVVEDPKPATNRQARRRDEAAPPSEQPSDASLAAQVVISSNTPDNWMMGIHGLKVTVQNRNAVALQTATVQVSYYDSGKKLLDTKTLYFHNVPAKGRMTVAAPDHKFADHVDLKLGTVTGKGDSYARN